MQHDLAFLQTANVHVETFSKIAEEVNPGMRMRHGVAEELLEEARENGIRKRLHSVFRRRLLSINFQTAGRCILPAV